MNKRNVIVSIIVICAVLVLGAVICNVVSVPSAGPGPTLTPSPQPTGSPSPSPTPTESPSLNPEVIVVPDDYSTIQAAIDSASEGGTIFVKRGIYYDQTLIINKSLSLIGEDSQATILRGPDVNYSVANAAEDKTGCTLLRAEVSPLNFIPPQVIVIQINASNVEISDFFFTNCDVGISGNGDGTKIVGNFIATRLTGISLSGSYANIAENTVPRHAIGGIQCSGSYNNITRNTLDGAIGVQGSFNTITGNSAVSITLENADLNTISNNTCGLLQLGAYSHACSNNTIWKHGRRAWYLGHHDD